MDQPRTQGSTHGLETEALSVGSGIEPANETTGLEAVYDTTEIEANVKDRLRGWETYPNQLYNDASNHTGVVMADLKASSTRLNNEGKRIFFRDESQCKIPVTVCDETKKTIVQSTLTDLTSLQQHFCQLCCRKGYRDIGMPKSVIYMILGIHTWSKLLLPEEAFRKILSFHRVSPAYLNILYAFGQGIDTVTEGYVSYFDRIHLPDEMSSLEMTSEYCTQTYEIGYNIKYIDRHNRPAKDPFSVRHIGVYQKFDSETQRFTWILIQAPERLREMVNDIQSAYLNSAANMSHDIQLEIHLLIISYCCENWSQYVNFYEKVFTELGPQAPGDLAVDITDIRGLYAISNKVRRIVHLLDMDILLIRRISRYLGMISRLKSERNEGSTGCKHVKTQRMNETEERCSSFEFLLDVERRRLGSILERADGVGSLIEHLINFRNSDSNASTNLNMRTIAEQGLEENVLMRTLTSKAAKDTESMKTIAVVTTLFLPATFIASLFGTNFFSYDASKRLLIPAKNTWIYFLITVSSTFVIVAIVLLRKKRMDFKTTGNNSDPEKGLG